MKSALMEGKGISPGIAMGKLKHVTNKIEAKEIKKGDIVYSEHLPPPLPSIARNAEGFIISGSEADHSVSYIKELWKPGIITHDISCLKEGQTVTMDGLNGKIWEGQESIDYTHHEPLKFKLKTKIYLQMSIPRMAKKAANLNTGGVGLLRTNLIIEETGKHPYYFFIKKEKQQELIDILTKGIKEIAEAFKPKPVWLRTMDFATDELINFDEGSYEKTESNPLMGWRGLVRGLKQPELLDLEYQAISNVLKGGCTNLGIVYPLVRDISEYKEAKKRLSKFGITPHKDIKVGSMFETPSAALQIEEFIKEGLDLAFIGINDITQYTLAADRANLNMNDVYDPKNPAVLKLIYNLLEKCKESGIETTTSFLSPLKDALPVLLAKGLTSFTLQADRINEVAELVSKIEAH